MPDPEQDASAVSSSAPDAAATPSVAPETPALPEGSGQAPPLTSPPEVKPWNMPPEERWAEVIRQRDEAQRAYHELATRQPVAPPVQAPPEANPWEGLLNHPDPATAQFWQQQYKLQAPVLEKVQRLEQTVQTGTEELAALRVENFRLKNPDIQPNSPEELAIATYVKAGYPLDAARKMGLFDLHYGKLRQEHDTLRSKQGALPQKIAANGSEPTAGIPAASGLPKPPPDWRERVKAVYRKGGGLADAINAAGGHPVT